MKKTAFVVGLVFAWLAGCTPTPKPSNFDEFAKNEKGAALLVEYISNPKHAMQDRVKAMKALMARKWDIQVLRGLGKSPDKAALTEAVAKAVIPIYVKLCMEKNPNLEDIAYYRDQAFRLLEFLPKDKKPPYQKQIANAVFHGLTFNSSADEIKNRVTKRIMVSQIRELGKPGARGALIMIHHGFDIRELVGYLLDLKDNAINVQLFKQIQHITANPRVKIPRYYLDIVGQAKDIHALEWLLDRALDPNQEPEFQNYAFNTAVNMIDHKLVKSDIPGVVKRLEKFLDAYDPDLRWSGIYYMVYVEGTKAMPLVMKALKDDGTYPQAQEDPMKTMVDFCDQVMFEKGKPIPGAWEWIRKLLKSRNKVHKALGVICVKASKDMKKANLLKPFLKSRINLGSVFGDDKFTLGMLATNCLQGLKMMHQVDLDLAAKKLTPKQAKLKKLIIMVILDKRGTDYAKWVKKDFAAQVKTTKKASKKGSGGKKSHKKH